MIHKDLQNPYYVEWIRFLKSTENWTKEEIEEYQLQQIRKIIRHAFENVPGYKKLYKSIGLELGDIDTLNFGDFRRFPFIEKEMIRDNLEEFTYSTDDMEYVTTGGSTGIPFGFYRSKKAFARELASKAYQYYRVDWKEGVRQMVFRGIPINTEDHIEFYPEFNELRCSSYYLIPEQMEIYRQKAFEFQPEFLKGYPSSLYLFAKYLKETKKDFPEVKGILCASENLYDYQKELFKEVFKARIFSHYGHYEMAVLAGYCEYEDTYHVLPQYGYAELINKEGDLVTQPGQMGEIVSTSFLMYNTPFIRYRTRDFAIFKGYGCSSCGRPYQIWERIEGRLQEFIVTKKNRYISMTAINMHDDIFDPIKRFQFYQKDKGVVIFKYVPKYKLNSETVEDIKRRLLLKLGDDMDLVMQEVAEIPPTPRGKHRFLIQELKLDIGDL
jgi:phenylacetate-CoA ligase